jgi:hypothetical protein
MNRCRGRWMGAALGALLAVAARAGLPGELVVVIASKGQFKGEPDFQGMDALAECAHRYGHPVTWFLKPVTVAPAEERLRRWRTQYGDELGWFAEHAEPGPGEELAAMKKLVTWQPIRSAGNSRYDRLFVQLANEQEVEGIWGRAFEQSYAEPIADRGTTFGFHYLRPDCYKVPNPRGAGVVSVPWVSADLNLTFRTGSGAGFTFDPDDVLSIGVVRAGRIEYWKRLVDEYRRQTAWNEFVPLVIQQEYTAIGEALRRKDGEPLQVLDELFRYLRDQRIRVVTMADAVRLYRKASPDTTAPTYALFHNLGTNGLAAEPAPVPGPGRLLRMEVTSNRIAKASAGLSFNGFYAGDQAHGVRRYFDPEGRPYQQRGRLFLYYDVNGLLVFEEGNPQPLRITSYASLPSDPHKPRVLPELSAWYNTQNLIPRAELSVTNVAGGVRISARVAAERNAVFTGDRFAYGLMLWGDYSAYRLPPRASVGSRILGREGLFLPFPLAPGENRLDLHLMR